MIDFASKGRARQLFRTFRLIFAAILSSLIALSAPAFAQTNETPASSRGNKDVHYFAKVECTPTHASWEYAPGIEDEDSPLTDESDEIPINTYTDIVACHVGKHWVRINYRIDRVTSYNCGAAIDGKVRVLSQTLGFGSVRSLTL